MFDVTSRTVSHQVAPRCDVDAALDRFGSGISRISKYSVRLYKHYINGSVRAIKAVNNTQMESSSQKIQKKNS